MASESIKVWNTHLQHTSLNLLFIVIFPFNKEYEVMPK